MAQQVTNEVKNFVHNLCDQLEMLERAEEHMAAAETLRAQVAVLRGSDNLKNYHAEQATKYRVRLELLNSIRCQLINDVLSEPKKR